jgi:Domain of unknown function (DUF4157)
MTVELGQSLKKPCPKCGGRTSAGKCVRCSSGVPLDELGVGHALDGSVRSRAESAFGTSLESVRIHTDGAAQRIAGAEGAQAFAVGDDIGFGAGMYRPGTLEGDAIIAHEIAHTLQYDPRSDGSTTLTAEHDATRMAVDAGLHAAGRGGSPHRGTTLGLGLSRCDGETKGVKPVKGIAPALPAGEDYDIHKVAEYIKMWEQQQGRKMTDKEKETLRAGCIGITAVNLGRTSNPPLTECFDTLEQAKKRREELEKSTGAPHFLFSKRFFSDGKDYTPNAATGKVDMSQYSYKAKPGWVNFDYGWYDEASGNLWHANEGGPKMEVYQSTPKEYAKPYGGFDKQVWCVAPIQK